MLRSCLAIGPAGARTTCEGSRPVQFGSRLFHPAVGNQRNLATPFRLAPFTRRGGIAGTINISTDMSGLFVVTVKKCHLGDLGRAVDRKVILYHLINCNIILLN